MTRPTERCDDCGMLWYLGHPCVPRPPEQPAHDWTEPEIDWKATRTCKRCGIINEYNHGPSGPKPERYVLPSGRFISKDEPPCRAAEQPARTIDNRFHELWTQAVGSPGYVKDHWRALEGALVRSLDTRESEVLLRIAEIVVAHSQQPAEQPARGDGVRRTFEGRPCDVFGQRAFDNGGPTPIGLLTMLCGLEGKLVRIDVTVLDDAPGKE